MVFEKKKLQMETLGEYLKEVRQSLRMDEDEVSKKTGIGKKFLQALEAGNYKQLPAEVYVHGFLVKLAEVYGVEVEALTVQYKKERTIQTHLQGKEQEHCSAFKSIFKKIIITPKNITWGSGIFLLSAIIIYIIWQVFSINATPSLEIFEPKDRSQVSGTFVKVLGKTDAGMQVKVNDQNVFVTEEGKFEAQVGIAPGPKELVVIAYNKFNKSSKKIISVVGQTADLKNTVEVALKFLGDVTADISADGKTAEHFVFKNGDEKTVSAQTKVNISVSDAGKVKATVNGQELGLLGRSGEVLKDIPFTVDSVNK